MFILVNELGRRKKERRDYRRQGGVDIQEQRSHSIVQPMKKSRVMGVSSGVGFLHGG